jgi:SAM-dependent methyltransferase
VTSPSVPSTSAEPRQRDPFLIRSWRAFRQQGIVGVAKKVHRRLFLLRTKQHPFDRQFGVDTSGFIAVDDLKTGHPNEGYSEAYWGTAPSLFAQVMEAWRATLPGDLKVEDYSFFDLGCGKGRVVLMASDIPFRSVTGIELNPKLTAIARENLSIWMRTQRACQSTQVLTGDATAPELPDGPVLLYLFNSFNAHLVKLLVDQLLEQAPERSWPVDILYTHALHPACFEQTDSFEMIAKGEVTFSWNDASADVFGASKEDFRIYRLAGSATIS